VATVAGGASLIPSLDVCSHRSAKTLMRLTPQLPAGWAEQRKLLGFR
jgi:hypothetical protein